MNTETNFQSLSFKLLFVDEVLSLNPKLHPDINPSLDTKYFLSSKAKNCSDAMECLCIEINNKNSKNSFFILGCRPPSDSNLSEKDLKYALSKMIKEIRQLYKQLTLVLIYLILI